MTSPHAVRGLGLVGAAQVIGVVTSLVLAGVSGDRVTLVLARFAFGAIVFAWTWRQVRTLDSKAWLGAGLYAADIALFLVALAYAPLAVVIAITCLTPLLAVGVERARGHARLTRWGLAAVVLGTAGAAASAGVSLLGAAGNAAAVGVGLAVASAVTAAAGTVLLQESGEHSPWALTQAVNLAGAALMIPLAAWFGLTVTAPILGAALIAAVGGGGLATVAFIAALRYLPASVAMSLGAVGLPAAAILGALFLDQPVNVVAGAGYLAVASTVFIAALRPLSAAAPQGQTLSPAAR